MATRKPKAVTKQPETPDKENDYWAEVTLLPSANAAAVISEYGKAFGDQDIAALIDGLRTKFDEVNNGDLHQCEAMLVGQAFALQSIFMNLSRRAAKQDYLKQLETYLRLAFKAQSQCRMTLETLAAIKNPPVVFAKQANISHGHQQVNNGVPVAASHAEKNINQQNELLEAQYGGKALDTRATGTATDIDKAMATVGEINRSEITKGQGQGFSK